MKSLPSRSSLIESSTIKDLLSAVLVDIGALYKASEAVSTFLVNTIKLKLELRHLNPDSHVGHVVVICSCLHQFVRFFFNLSSYRVSL